MDQDSEARKTWAIRKAQLTLIAIALGMGVIGAVASWINRNSADAIGWLGVGILLAAVSWTYGRARLGRMKMWLFLVLSQVFLAIYILTAFVTADWK